MKKRRHKLFHENMPGNYMPANRDGWVVLFVFISVALLVVFAGHAFDTVLDSPWPSRISWGLFILLTIRFVIFAKRHS